MSFHVASFHNLQQEITKLGNFMNSQKFSPKIHKFPGIPAGNFWSGGFPGVPGNSRTGIPRGLAFVATRFEAINLQNYENLKDIFKSVSETT